MNNCLICNSKIVPFIDFGEMPIANGFLKKNEIKNEFKFKLTVGFCDNCKMVQLIDQPSREIMFHENYSFFSSTSLHMINHFKKFYEDVKKLKNLNKNSFVVEIGCNDAILIENFLKNKIPCLGVEPSNNVAEVAIKKGLNIIKEFFDENVAKKINNNYKKADLILSANVMCHIPYMHSIFKGVKKLLDKNGLFIFEDPYLGDVINKTSFDQIYDEHVFLFSALSVNYIANMYNLKLIDLKSQKTHGGSMRYYIVHKNKNNSQKKVIDFIEKEKIEGLNKIETFNNFQFKIDKIKIDLINLLKKIKKEGKKIVGYGATSKSTTVTNYFGIDISLIDCIFDNTPIKQYKLSPGKHIPILPYEDFRSSNPDYVLLFAWNHAEEIFEKEKNFMNENRKWITYIPKVKIH